MPARVLPRLIFANQLSTSFSALTLLVGRQEGHPACNKTEWLGAGVVICLERGAALHAAQLMPLPLTCFSKIRIGVTFLVPAHPGSPGQRAVKRVCVALDLSGRVRNRRVDIVCSYMYVCLSCWFVQRTSDHLPVLVEEARQVFHQVV